MTVYRCSLDLEYVNLAEVMERQVVAQGWNALGDLSPLLLIPPEEIREEVHHRFNAHCQGPWQPAIGLTFRYLLDKISPGDIILGTAGQQIISICEICECTTYRYDVDHEYAHGLCPVNWIPIEEFLAAQPNVVLPNLAARNLGIRRVKNHIHAFQQAMQQFHNDHPDAQGIGAPQELCAAWQEYRQAHPETQCNEQQIADCRQHERLRMISSRFDEIKSALSLSGQVILCGPPGTGKTHVAKAYAETHYQGNFEIVQFHPSYNYEDFVRGIQASTADQGGQVPVLRYDTVHRVFSKLCNRASMPENAGQKYLLIIDEINRAHLAAVLGELIYALEYREQPIRTPYRVPGGEYALTVPANLHIIGTMNTADRSVGHIDYAVRRRFAFVPMLPSEEVIKSHYNRHDHLRSVALALYNSVARLFTSPERSRLSPEFHKDDVQPGHTYFLVDLDRATASNHLCERLILKFVYQVLPLLREYVKDGVLTGEDIQLQITDGPTIPLSDPFDGALMRKLIDLCPRAPEGVANGGNGEGG